jgi:hypothetical protein
MIHFYVYIFLMLKILKVVQMILLNLGKLYDLHYFRTEICYDDVMVME